MTTDFNGKIMPIRKVNPDMSSSGDSGFVKLTPIKDKNPEKAQLERLREKIKRGH